MREAHVYEKDGVEWKRIFTVPNASIDTQVDAFSKNKFIEKTGNMKGTVGDVLDMSADLSRIRSERTGEDPVKRKFFDDYKNKVGQEHYHDKKKTFETSKVRIDLD